MKKTQIIGLVVIGLCIAILIIVLGQTPSNVPFRLAALHPDHSSQVAGVWVKERGIEYDPKKDPNYFAFYMKDDSGTVKKVIYRDEKPFDFERADRVVIKGKCEGDDFDATEMLMKCPSKYNGTRVEVKEKVKNI